MSTNVTSMLLALEKVKAATYFSHPYDTIFFTIYIVHREEKKSDTKKNMYKYQHIITITETWISDFGDL